jgi:hypothetical protein
MLADTDAYIAAIHWMIGFEYESEYQAEVEVAKTFFTDTQSEDSE